MKAEQVQHDQRVNVDGKALHQTLLDGVRDACSCSGVRGGTHTCLIGEQAALNAENDNRTREAAEDRLEVESGFANGEAKTAGNWSRLVNVMNKHKTDISKSHDGHQRWR